MKKQWIQAFQIAATYMGTIVGAGFATGQEILQFFTKYGVIGMYTITLATFLFIWLGYKVMVLASQIQAKSYEDLNIALFGNRWGKWVSLFMIIVLLGVSAVMLAGAGTIFYENWDLPYQLGLFVTMIGCFLLLKKGLNAILAVNSIVVPIMLLFTFIVFYHTLTTPGGTKFLYLSTDHSIWAAWAAPFLYLSFNLSLAQAVLVPIGAQIQDKTILRNGAILGALGIGFMLMVGHIALSSRMPGVTQFAIPMGGIARELGMTIQYIYTLIIFAEVFTTMIANIYGLTLQLQERLPNLKHLILITILICCYLASQIGFGPLLSTLYPLFGFISLGWLFLIIVKRVSH